VPRSFQWRGLVGAAPDWRTRLVAALTAITLAAAVVHFKGEAGLAPALAFILLLGLVVSIEIKTGRIPDVIVLPGTLIGAILRTLVTGTSLRDTLAGIVVGGGVFLLIILISRGGIGGGVMKLGAMVGAFLGWRLTLAAILCSLVAALVVRQRQPTRTTLEFGPFLASASLLSLFWGERLLSGYFNP
jgi:leader peptidase (prepilin peptidase) / N-methyltransferase